MVRTDRKRRREAEDEARDSDKAPSKKGTLTGTPSATDEQSSSPLAEPEALQASPTAPTSPNSQASPTVPTAPNSQSPQTASPTSQSPQAPAAAPSNTPTWITALVKQVLNDDDESAQSGRQELTTVMQRRGMELSSHIVAGLLEVFDAAPENDEAVEKQTRGARILREILQYGMPVHVVTSIVLRISALVFPRLMRDAADDSITAQLEVVQWIVVHWHGALIMPESERALQRFYEHIVEMVSQPNTQYCDQVNGIIAVVCTTPYPRWVFRKIVHMATTVPQRWAPECMMLSYEAIFDLLTRLWTQSTYAALHNVPRPKPKDKNENTMDLPDCTRISVNEVMKVARAVQDERLNECPKKVILLATRLIKALQDRLEADVCAIKAMKKPNMTRREIYRTAREKLSISARILRLLVDILMITHGQEDWTANYYEICAEEPAADENRSVDTSPPRQASPADADDSSSGTSSSSRDSRTSESSFSSESSGSGSTSEEQTPPPGDMTQNANMLQSLTIMSSTPQGSPRASRAEVQGHTHTAHIDQAVRDAHAFLVMHTSRYAGPVPQSTEPVNSSAAWTPVTPSSNHAGLFAALSPHNESTAYLSNDETASLLATLNEMSNSPNRTSPARNDVHDADTTMLLANLSQISNSPDRTSPPQNDVHGAASTMLLANLNDTPGSTNGTTSACNNLFEDMLLLSEPDESSAPPDRTSPPSDVTQGSADVSLLGNSSDTSSSPSPVRTSRPHNDILGQILQSTIQHATGSPEGAGSLSGLMQEANSMYSLAALGQTSNSPHGTYVDANVSDILHLAAQSGAEDTSTDFMQGPAVMPMLMALSQESPERTTPDNSVIPQLGGTTGSPGRAMGASPSGFMQNTANMSGTSPNGFMQGPANVSGMSPNGFMQNTANMSGMSPSNGFMQGPANISGMSPSTGFMRANMSGTSPSTGFMRANVSRMSPSTGLMHANMPQGTSSPTGFMPANMSPGTSPSNGFMQGPGMPLFADPAGAGWSPFRASTPSGPLHGAAQLANEAARLQIESIIAPSATLSRALESLGQTGPYGGGGVTYDMFTNVSGANTTESWDSQGAIGTSGAQTHIAQSALTPQAMHAGQLPAERKRSCPQNAGSMHNGDEKRRRVA